MEVQTQGKNVINERLASNYTEATVFIKKTDEGYEINFKALQRPGLEEHIATIKDFYERLDGESKKKFAEFLIKYFTGMGTGSAGFETLSNIITEYKNYKGIDENSQNLSLDMDEFIKKAFYKKEESKRFADGTSLRFTVAKAYSLGENYVNERSRGKKDSLYKSYKGSKGSNKQTNVDLLPGGKAYSKIIINRSLGLDVSTYKNREVIEAYKSSLEGYIDENTSVSYEGIQKSHPYIMGALDILYDYKASNHDIEYIAKPETTWFQRVVGDVKSTASKETVQKAYDLMLEDIKGGGIYNVVKDLYGKKPAMREGMSYMREALVAHYIEEAKKPLSSSNDSQ